MMAADAVLKITKIAIYPQRFDRSLRNLVRWCKMGLLTAPAVKKFEFHKSKMDKLQFLVLITDNCRPLLYVRLVHSPNSICFLFCDFLSQTH